ERLRTTEHMAREHQRRALELEAILATMTDALIIVDARGAIVQLNRAARELLRLDNASLVVGQPLEEQRLAQWPASAREIAAALVPVAKALRAGESVAERDVELRSKRRRVLNVSASVMRGPKVGALQTRLRSARADASSVARHRVPRRSRRREAPWPPERGRRRFRARSPATAPGAAPRAADRRPGSHCQAAGAPAPPD